MLRSNGQQNCKSFIVRRQKPKTITITLQTTAVLTVRRYPPKKILEEKQKLLDIKVILDRTTPKEKYITNVN